MCINGNQKQKHQKAVKSSYISTMSLHSADRSYVVLVSFLHLNQDLKNNSER